MKICALFFNSVSLPLFFPLLFLLQPFMKNIASSQDHVSLREQSETNDEGDGGGGFGGCSGGCGGGGGGGGSGSGSNSCW